MVSTGKRRGALARAVSAALILMSAPPVTGGKCYWCGPLAEQVHRSARAPACSRTPSTLTTCDDGHAYCATVATAPPYVESRYCVKLYQDECYHLYCNTTRTWRMTCPCRGDLCNGPNTEKEQEAFAILTKIAAKPHRVKKRSISTPTAHAILEDITHITIYQNTSTHNDANGTESKYVDIKIVKDETKLTTATEFTNYNENNLTSTTKSISENHNTANTNSNSIQNTGTHNDANETESKYVDINIVTDETKIIAVTELTNNNENYLTSTIKSISENHNTANTNSNSIQNTGTHKDANETESKYVDINIVTDETKIIAVTELTNNNENYLTSTIKSISENHNTANTNSNSIQNNGTHNDANGTESKYVDINIVKDVTKIIAVTEFANNNENYLTPTIKSISENHNTANTNSNGNYDTTLPTSITEINNYVQKVSVAIDKNYKEETKTVNNYFFTSTTTIKGDSNTELHTNPTDHYNPSPPSSINDVKKGEIILTSEDSIEPRNATDNDYVLPIKVSSPLPVIETLLKTVKSTSFELQPTTKGDNFKDETHDINSIENEIPSIDSYDKNLQNLKPTNSIPTAETPQQTPGVILNYQTSQSTTENYKYKMNSINLADNDIPSKNVNDESLQIVNLSGSLPTAEALHQTETIQKPSEIDSTPISPQTTLETIRKVEATTPRTDKKVEQTTQKEPSTIPTKKPNAGKNNAFITRESYFKQFQFFAVVITLINNIYIM